MKSKNFAWIAGLAVALTCGAAPAAFPEKMVKIVVPFGTGVMVDVIPREVATLLSKKWGQPVVIENRPGAASMIGAEYVAKSPADGYTILVASSSTLCVAPYLYKKLRFDPLKDLTPITLMGTAQNILTVSSLLPVNNLKELIALAKEKPGQLSYVTSGVGTLSHLQTIQLAQTAGISLVNVPYPSQAQAVADIATNRVQLLLDILPSNIETLRSGRLKPIAAMTDRRFPQFPDVPTIVEEGYPALAGGQIFGFVAPKGTPQDVIHALQTGISEALNDPELKKKYGAIGFNLGGSTPEAMQKLVDATGAAMKKLIEEAHISID